MVFIDLVRYFWLFSLPGYIELSREGRRIQKNKQKAWISGKKYLGPRESIYEQADNKARESNRKRLLPYFPTYIKRWCVLSLVFFALAQFFANLNVFIFELIFTISTLLSLCITMFLTWFWKDLLDRT